MNRGLYTAVSAMITGLVRQEAISHNLSNVRTTAYKADRAGLTDFPSLLLTQVKDGRSVTRVGQAGTGVSLAAITTDFETGPVNLTDNPLDFAVAGEGFFQIQTDDGIRYSRDGRFHKGALGRLLTVDNHVVLGADGPITLPDGAVTVNAMGDIFVDDELVAQFSMVKFEDKTALQKAGQTMFSADQAAAQPMDSQDVQVYQGYLEGSNVDPTQMITEMMTVMRAYQLSQRMVQYQDGINGRAVGELGRV